MRTTSPNRARVAAFPVVRSRSGSRGALGNKSCGTVLPSSEPRASAATKSRRTTRDLDFARCDANVMETRPFVLAADHHAGRAGMKAPAARSRRQSSRRKSAQFPVRGPVRSRLDDLNPDPPVSNPKASGARAARVLAAARTSSGCRQVGRRGGLIGPTSFAQPGGRRG